MTHDYMYKYICMCIYIYTHYNIDIHYIIISMRALFYQQKKRSKKDLKVFLSDFPDTFGDS